MDVLLPFQSSRRPWVPSKAAFDPMSLSPSLWLKADTLALNDGDPVTTWADQSGNGLDFSQATSAAKPTFKVAIQNGLPVVQFDGVDDWMSGALLNNQAARTLYSVARGLGGSTHGRRLLAWTTNSGIQARSGVSEWFSTGPLAAFTGDNILNWNVRVVKLTSVSSVTPYLNGTAGVTGDPDDIYAGGTDNLILGALPGPVNLMNCQFGELIVYNAAHSDSDRNNVEGYLKTRWATP